MFIPRGFVECSITTKPGRMISRKQFKMLVKSDRFITKYP